MSPLTAICLALTVGLTAAAFFNNPSTDVPHEAATPAVVTSDSAAAAAAPTGGPSTSEVPDAPAIDRDAIEARIQSEIVGPIQNGRLRFDDFSRAALPRRRVVEYGLEPAPSDDVLVFRIYERHERSISNRSTEAAAKRQLAVGRFHVATGIFELAPGTIETPPDSAYLDVRAALKALGAGTLPAFPPAGK